MATVIARTSPTTNGQRLREDWLERVSNLVESVEKWAEELGWATRRIDKEIEDSEIGRHRVPALLLQQETTRMLLDPIARSAPGAEGVVDLYVMPAFDDVASLYFYNGEWQLCYSSAAQPVDEAVHDAQSEPLSKQTFQRVVEEMRGHGG